MSMHEYRAPHRGIPGFAHNCRGAVNVVNVARLTPNSRGYLAEIR
jgi:hypothetical protein